MKDYPVLFSAPMVRAILAGTKHVTRRLITELPLAQHTARLPPGYTWNGSVESPALVRRHIVGDLDVFASVPFRRAPWRVDRRLWVREAWQAFEVEGDLGIAYRASCAGDEFDHVHRDGSIRRISIARWRPGIHLRRAAARIALQITRVRVERLQDITEADAAAEGVAPFFERFPAFNRDQRLTSGERAADAPHRAAFAVLWDELNGDRAAWASNPFVWAVDFRRVELAR